MDARYIECSICAEIFIDTRLLPCGHTICFKCLTSWLSPQTEDRILCPLCRNDCILCEACTADDNIKESLVPAATMHCTTCEESLCGSCSEAHRRQRVSGNHTVLPIDDNMKRKWLGLKLSSKSDKFTSLCDCCKADNDNENKDVPTATLFCTNCDENYCDDCSKAHKKQRLSKDHKVVPIDENMKKQFAMNKRCTETIPTKADSFTKLVKIKKLFYTEMTDLLKDESYSKLRQMVEIPAIEESGFENFWSRALPYIIQCIKTWNGYVLTAQNIAAMVMVDPTQKQKRSARFSDNTIQDTTIYPISRLDSIAYIINAADSIVVQDILRIMSKFPMAIPLVIPDIEENGKYIVVVPAMQSIVVKWESTPGQIAENHLFSSPFRMICAVRLGTNKIGKSTMLNQLMRKQFMFSSNSEPGSRYGRPLTLDGTVEIVWLTQETCSDTTWKTTVHDHYKRNTEEVAILANLHGDALKYPDTLKYLEHLACSFIVFRMPNSNDDEFLRLRNSISCQNLVPVLVDPNEKLYEESDIETIYTDSLIGNETQEIVRSLLQSSLNFHLSTNSTNLKPPYLLEESKSLSYIESLQCKKSEEILDIVKKQGCFRIKHLLLNIDVQQHTRWNENLKRLLRVSLDIFNQQKTDAKKSLTYLENQLSKLSASESETARAQVSEANKKLRRIIVKVPKKSTAEGDSDERQHQADLKKAQDELQSAMEKVDNINLGQEHFFRALGQMYEKSFGVTDLGEFNSIRNLPRRFADLLISGHAIEMLNGDSGEIQLVWIKAICKKVSKKLPNLKVFVISIIGLQSSGKSTLLNALFACRFAVSVGRCSRGLFMRMILLEEPLRKTYGCDAFILIDTEGLCSPEKMNDPKASQKDRLMATFAMGVSNLTMVNILGEGMTEMTEILQIAIVAMARLREGGIKPDILMVQHLQERNLAKIDQAQGQFCEAIKMAFELISKNDVEIGAASEECLAELTTRIQSGDIFKHFGAFKDGSSVNSPPSETYHEDVLNLFETLLNRTLALQNKSTFELWSNHFESYWGCVREETFALNFKNVKHISDFLYFEKKIAKVKELNDSSLRHHREFFANKIREEIHFVKKKKQKVGLGTDSMRTNMLKSMEQELQAIPHECLGECKYCEELIPHNCPGECRYCEELIPHKCRDKCRYCKELIQHQCPDKCRYCKELIQHQCPDKCRYCKEFDTKYSSLLQEIESTEWAEETRHSLKIYNEKLHENTMKVLRQTFDGSVLKQRYFSEFSGLITSELNTALKKRPTGKFSTQEESAIVDNTWRLLQGIAVSQESTPDLQKRIDQALIQSYVVTGILRNIVQDLSVDITVEDLSERSAIKFKFAQFKLTRVLTTGSYDKLTKDLVTSLISDLEQLVETVLQSRREDYSNTGLDFDEGMVSEIKTMFPTTMKEYEETFNITLHDKFKMVLQIYTLQRLRNRMIDLQTQWNSENNPNEILEKKKDDYIKEIETRLKYGFSCAGEGILVARSLFTSVRQYAIQAVNNAKIQAVKDEPWTTNSEKIRLRYFSQLAEEVEAGEKGRALAHFSNPKDSIELWFTKEVDSMHSKQWVLDTYCKTFESKFECVKKEISNSESKTAIDEISIKQIKNAGDRYFSQLDPKDDDFNAFRSSIVCTLDSLMDSENCCVKFGLASDDLDIKKRLGCSKHCFWCGALCWGSRDHWVGKNSNLTMDAHHSCHQPSGLKGVTNRFTKRLSTTACHNMTAGWRVWFGEFQDDAGMLWPDAKRDHFKDWKFDAHCITTFDELMRWFFQQLHRDIAESQGSSPADDKELRETRCTGLSLDKILDVVRSEI